MATRCQMVDRFACAGRCPRRSYSRGWVMNESIIQVCSGRACPTRVRKPLPGVAGGMVVFSFKFGRSTLFSAPLCLLTLFPFGVR